MAPTSVMYIAGKRQNDEHETTRKVIADFDTALKDLKRSGTRLQAAADKYKERLEGTKHG